MTRRFNAAGPCLPSKHYDEAWIRLKALVDASNEYPCG